MSRPLDDLRLAVLMLDGIELKGRCCVVALGIDTDRVKHPLGRWDGSTENATVAITLLSNLVERGLDVEQGALVIIDGTKALNAVANFEFERLIDRSRGTSRALPHVRPHRAVLDDR
jgi:putative transposase